ncbi:hypothetical protein [Paenibacillus sp. S28]|nr:hypothetical protein [Paenibacillus sp. S28]MBJ9993252.1 hypothetical protein [Paenibacillus sp. S28]
MKKSILNLLVAAVVLTVPMSSVNAENDAMTGNSIVQEQAVTDVGYIDPKLPEKDKQILKEVMKNLDKEDRENVFFIDETDGFFTSNRQDRLNEYKLKYKDLVSEDGKLKKKPNYKDIVQDKSELTCETSDESAFTTFGLGYSHPSTACASANSGPYRKVLSVPGKSRITANVYLPVKGTEIYMNPKDKTVGGVTKKTGDAADMYLGALNTIGTKVYQVDAGLQFNWGDGKAPETPTEETWGMISLGMGSVISGSPANFKMGTTAFMKFYIPQSNQAALSVSGTAKDGTPLSQTIVWNVDSEKGFTTYGTAMQVKRITSIAQTTGYEDLTTGSYVYNAQWNDVKVGTASGTEQLMNASLTSTNCGYQPSNILVDWTSWAQETVKVKTGPL